MDLLREVPAGTAEEMNVIIEIPAGLRNKYEYNKKLQLFELDRVVPESMVFAADYGFIPQTHCDDGDPLDAYVLMREKTFPGILIRSRPVGMLKMIDGGEEDNKLICVPVDDMYYKDVKDIADLPSHIVAELRHFLEHYKDLQNKKVEITGVEGAAAAKEEFAKSLELFTKNS